MNRRTLFGAALVFLLTSTVAQAQFAGTGPRDNFRDTSILRPPAGSKVAIIVFEDLGCPACANAHPIEQQVAAQYHVPLLRYDFPIEGHIWTFEGAVFARYLQDKVSPALADQYRSDVFRSQMAITSKDDLHHYNQRWMQQHGQRMPFLLDPGEALAAKVKADYQLGLRLNVQYTPTIVVVSRDHYQVVAGIRDWNHPEQLGAIVAGAVAQTNAATPRRTPSRR